jgi:3-hydroxyacyl-CoA dehydrogenase
MEIKTFGVIGAGQMGNGIAQVAAASGLNVIMNDIKEEFVRGAWPRPSTKTWSAASTRAR